jgi:alpha-ketoglutarate-dependent taurine dioxygenase
MNATIQSDALDVVDLTPRIASEVRAGRDALLCGDHTQVLRSLLVARGVLAFRNIQFTDAELVRFARTLGPVLAEAGNEVLTMSLDEADTRVATYLRATQFWHVDNLGRGCPNFASMLLAREVPADGGETEFANMYAAWEDLPENEKAALSGLRLRHSFEHFQRQAIPDPRDEDVRQWRMMPVTAQPIVWRHRSGRTSLALSTSGFEIEGMSPPEGSRLLQWLFDFATQPRFVYRHRWSVGDLVVWDNSGTMHRARPFAEGAARRMSRVATEGVETVQ